jgi:hypothetical protein
MDDDQSFFLSKQKFYLGRKNSSPSPSIRPKKLVKSVCGQKNQADPLKKGGKIFADCEAS